MSDNYDKLLKNKISGAPEKKEEPAPKPRSKRSPARRALVLALTLVCAAGLLVCAAGVLGYRVSVDRRILPNTYVEGVSVGGLTREEADAFDNYVLRYAVRGGRFLSAFRGKGYGAQGLELLCAAAKENGITVLYDDIAVDNPAVRLFLAHGFYEDHRTEEKIVLKKDL